MTKEDLLTQIGVLINDNTSQDISPADVRQAISLLAEFIEDSINAIVKYQEPVSLDYVGSNIFTLPKVPTSIAEVRVYEQDDTFALLQKNDYSLSNDKITVTNFTFSDGMSLRVFYFA